MEATSNFTDKSEIFVNESLVDPEDEELRKQATDILFLFLTGICIFTAFLGLYLSISLPVYAATIGKRSILRTSLARMSFALLLLGNLCFVVETALVLWTIIKPTTDEKTCRLQEKLTNTMMAVAFYPIYLFLWSRQLSIYRDRRLASALPVWLRAFSKFTLFMIVSTLTGFVVILGSTLADPKKIDFKDGYCIKVDDTWSVAAAIGTMVIIQSLLLFLFWYPIMTALSTGHSSLGQYVRRCAILTLINSLSDVTTLAFMLVFMNTAPVPLLAVVYPINLMVNCCCCIFSYRGGSSMIFPWGELWRRFNAKFGPIEHKSKLSKSEKENSTSVSSSDRTEGVVTCEKPIPPVKL